MEHEWMQGTKENQVVEQHPNPQIQRLAVLNAYSISINNAKLFIQKMDKCGFPKERLLTPLENTVSPVPGLNQYQVESLIFNTRYQHQPFVIVMCESTQEVQQAYLTATRFSLPIRVRSGGHDHAGECSGDNVILIDVSRIKTFQLCENIATIGAGYRFYQLTPKLAEHDRMIAHGTCATVGLTGYIQGGGWGPWTRKYGMCCEHLVSATVVLGDGTITEVSAESNPHLFWALRGGGGMSYGIVTELRVKTFPLPKEIHRFELQWNLYKKINGMLQPIPTHPTIDVLKNWEQAIKSLDTPKLLGTNLQIDALPESSNHCDLETISHHCTMYGYWEGTVQDLDQFIAVQFGACFPDLVQVYEAHGTDFDGKKYDHSLMSTWGRDSLCQSGSPFPPDYDAPAPHKITSRLVSERGLKPEGYTALLQSLTSPLIKPENRDQGLFSYVTLGAITGGFYHHLDDLEDISFPYRQCQYTVQYQTWWNEEIKQKLELQNNPVLVDVNRAMDWIDKAREADIPGTYGAFISFKDPAIPTSVYFDRSYRDLIGIKEKYAKDKFNHLRTNKTII
ncbi:FAD-binding oxidoreductase [Vibrio alginolyticus]|uniref:FAD-binding oxidoreductase n=1 Tax=Vibrio TaxID=662 RepID=UPI001BD54F66|nr:MULTISPECIES: FAD-dependent oxidoreductase [Vibrio]EHK9546712.1 FAD-binding oxidoreductase [Vibrio alginolyticus]EHK9605106.1 FAD-binding oxidoreductase [Vibrio alginolyticus]ELA7324289.1 FAD-binding oxidoreductase [Vibrio alginolyticus]ELB1637948.1 FAD-binding oxidoreductase [Vibrio alginolyticus]MBS9826190.1 FAD-binding oxidoreductase [Vibrio alginolyticus]